MFTTTTITTIAIIIINYCGWRLCARAVTDCITGIWKEMYKISKHENRRAHAHGLRPWHSRVQNMKILQNVFTRGMYRSCTRECWCNCCCWDVVVVIGKVMILSSNPRALTCFVWGVSFFFDCCGRTSISCQNVGNILLRRVSVGEVHRVVLRHVEIGT